MAALSTLGPGQERGQRHDQHERSGPDPFERPPESRIQNDSQFRKTSMLAQPLRVGETQLNRSGRSRPHSELRRTPRTPWRPSTLKISSAGVLVLLEPGRSRWPVPARQTISQAGRCLCRGAGRRRECAGPLPLIGWSPLPSDLWSMPRWACATSGELCRDAESRGRPCTMTTSRRGLGLAQGLFTVGEARVPGPAAHRARRRRARSSSSTAVPPSAVSSASMSWRPRPRGSGLTIRLPSGLVVCSAGDRGFWPPAIEPLDVPR